MRALRFLLVVCALAGTTPFPARVLGVTTPPDNAESSGGPPPGSTQQDGQTAPGPALAGPSNSGTMPALPAPPAAAAPAPPQPPPPPQNWSHQPAAGAAAAAQPLQQSWVDFSAILPGLFPGVRHHVRRWTSATTSWISPNSPSSIIPEPPLRPPGLSACGCPPPASNSGDPPNVYGAMERDRLWTWCADFFDLPGEPHPEPTHFIPDIWAGRGPCRALDRRSILHRFPSEQVEQNAAGRYFLHTTAQHTMNTQSDTDEGLLGQLWPTELEREEHQVPDVDRRVFGGADSPAELRELWAAWVQTLLVRRGYILHDLLIFVSYRWLEASDREAWQRLIENEHFGPAPLGVWFYDTRTYAAQIRYYMQLGVPVYYRWETSFFAEPRLADLRPREPPTNPSLGIPNPPMSPHRSANKRAQALWTHDHSRRAPPPRPRPEDDLDSSEPEVLDEKEYALLSETMAEIEDHWQRRQEPGNSSQPHPVPRPPLRDRITDGIAVEGGTSAPVSAAPGLAARLNIPGRSLLSRFDAGSGPAGSSRGPTTGATRSLLSRFDAGSGPAGSSRGPTAEAQARTITTVARTPPGVHQEGFHDSWRFAVTTDTPASRSFLDMLRAGQLPTHQERIGFSFTTGMPFATPVPRQPMAFDIAQSWLNHAVRDDWFIQPGMTPAEQFARWRESATRVLARPHARAALLRGGILARIASYLGLDLGHALQGPSDDARMNGTPFPMEDGDGTELWDDYLSADEIAILVGQVGVGGTLTLFPRPETFATFWWSDGAWTEEHEHWFQARLRELSVAGSPMGRTREAWRSALKRNQRYPQS